MRPAQAAPLECDFLVVLIVLGCIFSTDPWVEGSPVGSRQGSVFFGFLGFLSEPVRSRRQPAAGQRRFAVARGGFPRVRESYRGSRQVIASQGNLARITVSYRGPGKLSADRGKLSRLRESYRGLRQVSASQGKLPRLAASYRGPGKVSASPFCVPKRRGLAGRGWVSVARGFRSGKPEPVSRAKRAD